MSNGRKVKVEFTQAEAWALFDHAFKADYKNKESDYMRRINTALDKIAHQLNAVRGKVSGGAA